MNNFMKKNIFIISSIVLASTTIIQAKTINIYDISLVTPDDVIFKKNVGPDFEVYYFYKNNDNILNMYIGNFPNKNILEKPLKYQEFNLNNQPNVKIPYWFCNNLKTEVCLREELLISNSGPSTTIQFFYKTKKEYMETSNNIIKSLVAPKIIIKLDTLVSTTDNTELPLYPCFYITLPKNLQIDGLVNTDNNTISSHSIRNIPSKIEKTDRIGFITIKNTTMYHQEELKKNTSINFLPFFENLKNKFKQININTLNLSDQEHPYYKNIITIPFKFKENQYYSTITSEIRADDDGLKILQILNSIRPSDDKNCKFE